MNSRYLWLIAAALLCGALAAVWYFSPGTPAPSARVRRQPIDEWVDEQGKTRLPEVHLITMPYPARIGDIQVQEGDRLRANQIIAQVSEEDLANEVAEAQAAVDRLSASIRENDDTTVETGTLRQSEEIVKSMGHTVKAAEARKSAGQSRLTYAETVLGRVRQLLPTGGKSQDDLDRAEVAAVEGKVDYQQDVLVWEALRAMESATAILPQIVRDYIARKSLTRAVLEKQQLEAQARLRQAQLRQERGTLRSPVDGVVLERRIENEQFLNAGEVLVRIGQIEQLEVETEVLSQDVVRIQVGDRAEIYGPAIGKPLGAGVPGAVARIYPSGFTKLSSLGVEQQRVKVIVRFDADYLEPLRQMGLGVEYRVRVRIFTDSRDGALTVPRSALFRGADGGWYVFVVRSGRARLQGVDVGLMNDDQVEIVAGLEDEEIVVLAPESSLTEGVKVRPLVRDNHRNPS